MIFRGIPIYEVGQRVRYIGSLATVEKGEEGTIVFIQSYPLYELAYVCWDKEKVMRHSCDGRCEERHGWNVAVNELEVI